MGLNCCKEVEKRKRVEDQYRELQKSKKTTILVGPDFEEGPHSTMKEEQFFDAIDSTLDTLELEEERVRPHKFQVLFLVTLIHFDIYSAIPSDRESH